MERLARDKHFSLLRKSVNYGRNKFYDTGPWGLYYGTFTLVIDTSKYKFKYHSPQSKNYVSYSVLFTILVGWQASAVSLPQVMSFLPSQSAP